MKPEEASYYENRYDEKKIIQHRIYPLCVCSQYYLFSLIAFLYHAPYEGQQRIPISVGSGIIFQVYCGMLFYYVRIFSVPHDPKSP